MRRKVKLSEMMRLTAPPEVVFPLLCPVREYEWIEPWRCEIVHTVSGVNEIDCVFRTHFPGLESEVWVTDIFEPPSRLQFVRVGSHAVVRYHIELAAISNGTEVTWTQMLIPLDEAGTAYVALQAAGGYAERMRDLACRLEHYLKTGEMLRVA